MKIDLLPLINNFVEFIDIDEEVELPIDYYKNTDIRRLSKIELKGSINDIGENVYCLKLKASGIMILPCALSLEDVEYPFEINIEENVGNDEEFEKNYKIVSNTLDILPILWENIVLEIPNRIVKDNVKIEKSGDGWCLTDEGKLKSNNQLNDLKELLDMEERK